MRPHRDAPTRHHGAHVRHGALQAQRLCPRVTCHAAAQGCALLGAWRTPRAWPGTLVGAVCGRVPGGDRTAVPVSAAAVGLTDVHTGSLAAPTTPTLGLRVNAGRPPPPPLSTSWAHVLRPPVLRVPVSPPGTLGTRPQSPGRPARPGHLLSQVRHVQGQLQPDFVIVAHAAAGPGRVGGGGLPGLFEPLQALLHLPDGLQDVGHGLVVPGDRRFR